MAIVTSLNLSDEVVKELDKIAKLRKSSRSKEADRILRRQLFAETEEIKKIIRIVLDEVGHQEQETNIDPNLNQKAIESIQNLLNIGEE